MVCHLKNYYQPFSNERFFITSLWYQGMIGRKKLTSNKQSCIGSKVYFLQPYIFFIFKEKSCPKTNHKTIKEGSSSNFLV